MIWCRSSLHRPPRRPPSTKSAPSSDVAPAASFPGQRRKLLTFVGRSTAQHILYDNFFAAMIVSVVRVTKNESSNHFKLVEAIH